VWEACAALRRGWARQTAHGEEKDRPTAGGSVLRGATGRGGSEGWTTRGGGAEEREGEMGGMARSGAARRRGVGAASAQPLTSSAAVVAAIGHVASTP
jgi:hypothetical protein